MTTNGTTVTYSANAQNEITGLSGSPTPVYDANGNTRTDETGKQFVYDAWNRLITVKNAAGTTTLEAYTYDGLNRRVTNTVGSTTSTRYYSKDWQVVEEQVAGLYATRYVWSPVYVNALVQRDTDTSGTWLTATGTAYTRLWPAQDANWNVVALVNSSDTVVERYTYDPFGTATVLDGSYAVRSAGSSYAWVYLFQGGRLDAVTADTNFEWRNERSTLGRWTTMDPIGFAAGDANLYGFVKNNPANLIDPFGLADAPPFPSEPGISDKIANDELSIAGIVTVGSGFSGLFSSRDAVYERKATGGKVSPPRLKHSPNGDGTNIAAGTHKFFKLPSDGQVSYGTGGAESCTGLIILSPDSNGKYTLGAIFHFYASDDAEATLLKYKWDKTSKAIIFGANEETLSINTMEQVATTLGFYFRIKPEYTLDSDTVYVGSDGKWCLPPEQK